MSLQLPEEVFVQYENFYPSLSLLTVSLLSFLLARFKVDWVIIGHHKNLDSIGKQNNQEPRVEAELNFKLFEFYDYMGSSIYTVSHKKLGHFLRPITLEILNRYLPNLAQIKVSSF